MRCFKTYRFFTRFSDLSIPYTIYVASSIKALILQRFILFKEIINFKIGGSKYKERVS